MFQTIRSSEPDEGLKSFQGKQGIIIGVCVAIIALVVVVVVIALLLVVRRKKLNRKRNDEPQSVDSENSPSLKLSVSTKSESLSAGKLLYLGKIYGIPIAHALVP